MKSKSRKDTLICFRIFSGNFTCSTEFKVITANLQGHTFS